MANKQLRILVILSLVCSSIQDVSDNKVDSQEESPLADIAKQIVKEQNLENIGGLVNNFVQTGGAKMLMDGVVKTLSKDGNSGKLLQALGGILNSANDDTKGSRAGSKRGKEKPNDEINPMELLSNLGSVVGLMQGADTDGQANPSAALLQGLGSLMGGGNNEDGGAALLQGLGSLMAGASQGSEKKQDDNGAGAILQGIGSLLGAAAGGTQEGDNNAGALLQGLGALMGGDQNGQGGLNPEMIGNVINMFANSQKPEEKHTKKSKSKMHKKAVSPKLKSKKVGKDNNQDDSPDLGNIIGLAANFFNNGQGGSNFMDLVPMILNTIKSLTGAEAEERAKSHSDHSWSIPPLLEKVHLFLDNLMHTEMAKQLVEYVTRQQIFKVFQDNEGNFDYEKFKSLVENHSFRKYWIRQLADKIVGLLRFLSQENVQRQYIDMGVMFTNSYLVKSGFPKSTLIDLNSPVKSINSFAKYAAKEYLDSDIDTTKYVEPIVVLLQDLFRMTKETLLVEQPKELIEKVTDVINMEIIEPITRVNRAYRFAMLQPKCDKYVFCVINDNKIPMETSNLPKLKKSLYKGYSLIAAWFLTSHTGTSYLDFYAAVIEDNQCHLYHTEACNGFFDEEIKATTEYVHTEL